MNTSQRKYLMEEVEKIYINKRNKISDNYKTYRPYLVYDVEGYIEEHNLKNELKFKSENEKEFINNIINTLENFKNNNDEYWVFENNTTNYLTDVNTYFDTKEIKNKIEKEHKEKEMRFKKLENKYNEICDIIMLNTNITNYIKEEMKNNSDLTEEEIIKYIGDFENYEV